MILYHEEAKTFSLHTKRTTYQCKVGPFGVLLHLYYGARVGAEDLSHLIVRGDRGFSGNPVEAGADRTFSLDTLPQEYPSCGVGDYRVTALRAVHENGCMAADFRYKSHEIRKGKYPLEGLPALFEAHPGEAETLKITLEDAATRLEVTLLYSVFYEADTITRAVLVKNAGKTPVSLRRALSASLDIPFGRWELIHFHGRHNNERELERMPVPRAVTTLRSTRGTSSHQQNPALILCSPDCTEDAGECYGLNLVYSGSFTAEVEQDQLGQTRVVLGQDSEQFCWALAPGAVFTAPEVVLSYSAAGLTRLSHNYHRIYRGNLCRGKWRAADRPILVNNWEATYFQFEEQKLLEIAGEAAALGMELFVMDDGWFGGRMDDTTSLGDWVVNEKKLPHGLPALVRGVHERGLSMGIWFEPEMVSEKSVLYKNHPEWVLRIPGREPNRSRSQLVLDLSRGDVRAYLFDAIQRVLASAPIAYVKWDMNRSICDWYSSALPASRQGELPHRYMLGLYELLERLTGAFPDILFEGCSGGGGRFDPGMLYYHPQIWCSDNTDAVSRLRIQYSTSFFYPQSTVGAHVSAVPNHQTGRVTPFHTRGVAAMAGCLGYELDVTRLSGEEKQAVLEQVSFYKAHRALLLYGDSYRLHSPYEEGGYTAWLVVSKDRKQWLLSVVAERVEANAAPLHLRLKGLNPAMVYEAGGSYTGEQLMAAGLTFPAPMGEYPAFQLYGSEKGDV